MVLVDANVLLYAINRDAREHGPAQEWMRGALAGTEAVGFAWVVTLAFLRLATHPAIFPQPLGPDQALDVVEAWLGAGPAIVPEPTARHLPLLRGLLDGEGRGGNLVGDAHLAALAYEHGATVVSFDRDFARFQGLSLHRPG